MLLNETLESRICLHPGHGFHAEVNFQPTDAPVPAGFIADTGFVYSKRPNGRTYGWNVENSAAARQRKMVGDARLDSLTHMQNSSVNRTWQIAVPAGWYSVTVSAGDAAYVDSKYRISVEGKLAVDGTPTVAKHWVTGTTTVLVTDGKLTVTNPAGGVNNKINYIKLEQTEPASPPEPQPPPVTAPTQPAPTNPNGPTTPTTPTVGYPTTGAWRSIASMPIPRTEAQQAVKDGMLYVFGGFDTRWDASRRVDVYDPSTNKWTRLPDMPQAITHAATVQDGNNVLFIGGYVGDNPGPSTRDVLVFNVKTKAWSTLPKLPQPRAGGGAGIVGTKVYFFGGSSRVEGSSVDSDHSNTWVLDLNKQSLGWNSRAAMPSPRNHLGYATLNGKVYAIGGQLRDREGSGNQALVHRYDPSADRWTKVADMPYALGHIHTGPITHGGRIIIAGGITNGFTNTNGIIAYDPNRDRWERIGTLWGPRKSVNVMIHGGGIYVVGGGNHTALATGYWAPWPTA